MNTENTVAEKLSSVGETPIISEEITTNIKPKKSKAQRMIEQQFAKQTMNNFVRWKMSKAGR